MFQEKELTEDKSPQTPFSSGMTNVPLPYTLSGRKHTFSLGISCSIRRLEPSHKASFERSARLKEGPSGFLALKRLIGTVALAKTCVIEGRLFQV